MNNELKLNVDEQQHLKEKWDCDDEDKVQEIRAAILGAEKRYPKRAQ